MAHATYAWFRNYNELVPHLRGESDRAAAILGASFLESAMRERFTDFLVDDPASTKLFEPYQPLSSFSALIDVSFCLGLLTRDMKADLNLIRKIRNHFAHHPEHFTFDMAPVSDWCRELTPARGLPIQNGGSWRIDSARDQYLAALAFTLIYFDRFVGVFPRRTAPPYPLER
jgi:hypothetical protein